MTELLVFDTEAEARTAEATIFSRLKAKATVAGYSIHADGSIIGKNAHTGRDAPDKQHTVRWAGVILRDTAWAADEDGDSIPGRTADNRFEIASPARKHPDIRIDDVGGDRETRDAGVAVRSR